MLNNTFTDESDLDFYIIVSDGVSDIAPETTKAYKAIRRVNKHPVDIIVGTKSRFESRKEIPSVGNEVYRKGKLLYEYVYLSHNKGIEFLKEFYDVEHEKINIIMNLMETTKWTPEQAMEAMEPPETDKELLMSKL